jgi:hypothetical protein
MATLIIGLVVGAAVTFVACALWFVWSFKDFMG